MASGDVVYSKTNVTVADLSVANFGSKGWTAHLNNGGTSTPRADITISAVLNTVEGAPFEVTKAYSITIVEV